MNLPLTYRQFLESKIVFAPVGGFVVSDDEINPLLKPHQKATVKWACLGGRRAIFAAFGLGKTIIQLEIMRLVMLHVGKPVLIVAPLGVRQEFMLDAQTLATGEHPDITEAQRAELRAWLDGHPERAPRLQFIRTAEAIEPGTIHLVNYETIREGKLDVTLFGAASLDEASVLRGFGGTKTFREFMRLFDGMAYKFVATATPSPNEYIELLAYSAFLEVMDIGQAKTRFFKRNSEKADSLTIHPHKLREFWMWVASWGLFIEKPSDLGFSDEGYALPGIDIHWHELPSDHTTAGEEKSGQKRLLKNAAASLPDAAREKRSSLAARVARVMEIINGGRETPSLSAGILSEEPGAAAGSPAGAGEAQLRGRSGSLSPKSETLERGEPREGGGSPSAQYRADAGSTKGEVEGALSGEQSSASAGELGATPDAIWPDASRLFSDAPRSEGRVRDLPRAIAEQEPETPLRGPRPSDGNGPGSVVPQVQRGSRTNEGRPSTPHGRSGLSDQVVLWCDLNDEQDALERAVHGARLTVASLRGSQEVDDREALMGRWKSRELSIFLSKPQMYGAGINMQQCHTMIFTGIGFKFQDLIQAVHRILRFGQKSRCAVHFVHTEAERPIRDAIEAKWRRHDEQRRIMTGIIREFGLSAEAMGQTLSRGMGVVRVEHSSDADGYTLVNADCVEETTRMAPDSVDLIVTSIPFSTQYEYSPNYADFGHTDDNAHFFAQMDYLIPQLFRVLKPGRVAAIHVKDRIVPGGLTGLGFQTLYAFSDDTKTAFQKHGFAYLSRKTIVTDVVRENNQTYRLGWTEQCKDGSRMGNGLPEYLLVFRKPPSDASNGYADAPVHKDKKLWEAGAWLNPEGYSRGRWQLDAHGFMRVSGNRLVTPEELRGLDAKVIYKLWRAFSLSSVYDFEHHVHVAEGLEQASALPSDFMLIPPHSWHGEVWGDIARMLSMNSLQAAAGREMHLCPLQFDIVDRCIVQYSQPGETVLDPFAGLMTVPFRALKHRRRGVGIELNPGYFADGAAYVEAMARDMAVPDLFGMIEEEKTE